MNEVSPCFIAQVERQKIDSPIVCDIGSRDAREGITLLKQLRARQLHVFEPNPVAAERCRKNISQLDDTLRSRVFFNEKAVSDEEGQCPFFAVDVEKSGNKDIGFSSMYTINPAYTRRRKSIVQQEILVNTITLDTYFAQSEAPDILWVDVEGAELKVFKGAASVLREVRVINVEVSFRAMQIGRALFWEVDQFLREAGFAFVQFNEVSSLKGLLYRHRLLPKPPWRLNAVYRK